MDLTITELTVDDISGAVRKALEEFFDQSARDPESTDVIGGIELAMQITGHAKATVYSLVSKRAIPHCKKRKRLYFSRNELLAWIDGGRRRTREELVAVSKKF